MSESIKAIYGGGFDGQRYLQRFFDLQYTLSAPDNLSFSTLILTKTILPDIDNIVYGLEKPNTLYPPKVSLHTALDVVSFVVAKHADFFSLSLRDITQVTTILEAAFAVSYTHLTLPTKA